MGLGASSLFRIQSSQNSYKGVKTNQIDIKTEDQSAKFLLSNAKVKSSNQSKTRINKISYIYSFLPTQNSSKSNNFLWVMQRQTEDFFLFLRCLCCCE